MSRNAEECRRIYIRVLKNVFGFRKRSRSGQKRHGRGRKRSEEVRRGQKNVEEYTRIMKNVLDRGQRS